MNILLDSNSIYFIYQNLLLIQNKTKDINFFYLPSQEIEINKIMSPNKLKLLMETLDLCQATPTAGVFMLNTPGINVERYFVNSSTSDTFKTILKKHNCNHKGQENFMADFDIAYSAMCNKYVVLTNDGAGKKDGLYKALKELNIKCLSHDEFKKLLN